MLSSLHMIFYFESPNNGDNGIIIYAAHMAAFLDNFDTCDIVQLLFKM